MVAAVFCQLVAAALANKEPLDHQDRLAMTDLMVPMEKLALLVWMDPPVRSCHLHPCQKCAWNAQWAFQVRLAPLDPKDLVVQPVTTVLLVSLVLKELKALLVVLVAQAALA
jgi:hypothetical protein